MIERLEKGERFLLPDKYKPDFLDPDAKFEIEYAGKSFGTYRFNQFKNGNPIGGIFALDQSEFDDICKILENAPNP